MYLHVQGLPIYSGAFVHISLCGSPGWKSNIILLYISKHYHIRSVVMQKLALKAGLICTA